MLEIIRPGVSQSQDLIPRSSHRLIGIPTPPKKRKAASFFPMREDANVGRFPHWNLPITKPHGVGPRVLRDGDFSNCAERPNKTQNTVEVFLPCKSWKANSAEKNWNDSFQKQKKKRKMLLSCYVCFNGKRC